MNKIIFIILLFAFIIFAQNDTTYTVKYNNISTPDTIDVNVIDNPSFTWLERNEGSLLSTIVGLLIAFITIYFSFRSSKKIEMTKQAKVDERIKEIYKGYLFAIKAELINHQELIPLIRQEFEAILIKSIELKQIILERPTRSIPIKFLAELRMKLLESEIYNTQVFAMFTAYLSKCELINTDSDLTSVITFIENQKEQINFEKALKDYLLTMLKQIDNVIEGGLGIIQYIDEDLKKLGVDLEKSEVNYLIRN